MECVCGASTAVARDLSSCTAPGVTDVVLRRHGRLSGCVPRDRQDDDGARNGRAEGRFDSWARPNETLGNERLFRAEGRTNMMAGVSLLPVARPPATRGRVEEHNGGRREGAQVIQAPMRVTVCANNTGQGREGEEKKTSQSPPDVQEVSAERCGSSIASEAKATFSTGFDWEGPAPKFCHRALTRR